MIRYVKGDLFKAKEDVLIQGCNCWVRQGKGVAFQVKRLYPGAFAADKETYVGDKTKLGTYTSWTGNHCYYPEQNITVVNAYTQFNYKIQKFDKWVYVDYVAIAEVFEKIYNDFPDKTIAIPKIGAGLAGGDWSKIEAIINNIFKDKEIVCYTID